MKSSNGIEGSTEAEDAGLLGRFLEGDEGAFEVLVRRYQKKIYVFCDRILLSPQDAEDVTQEAFLRVVRFGRGFRPERRFSSWLYGIALNLCRDRLKRRHRGGLTETTGSEEDFPAIEETPTSLFDRKVTREEIDKAFASLPLVAREVIALRYLDGLSYEEIGELLGVTVSAVAGRLVRGKALLRKAIERGGR